MALAKSLKENGSKISIVSTIHDDTKYFRLDNFDPVKNFYRVIITNSILQDSTKWSLYCFGKKVKIIECEIPDLLTSATLSIVAHIANNKAYHDFYTRCKELFDMSRDTTNFNTIIFNNLVTVGKTIAGQIDVTSEHSFPEKNIGYGAMCIV